MTGRLHFFISLSDWLLSGLEARIYRPKRGQSQFVCEWSTGALGAVIDPVRELAPVAWAYELGYHLARSLKELRAAMNREPGIEIRDLSYAYGTEPALQEVSLQVSHACFTALLGPNGAGKSTLVALLCGLIVPERGQIEVLGLDLGHRPRAALERMGLVFQPQTLDLDLTVRQNMAYFAALRGLSGADAKRRIETCLERLELAERGGEKARSLSGGHRRRVEIARALLHAPRLLILDEPTVGLDVPSRAALVQHVHALCAEDGLTVLWATHLVDEVWDDDRLVVLHRGRIRAAGPVREILSETGCSSVLEAFTDLTTEPL